MAHCIVESCVSHFPEYECAPLDGCAAKRILASSRHKDFALAQLDDDSLITANPYGDALVSAGLADHIGNGVIRGRALSADKG